MPNESWESDDQGGGYMPTEGARQAQERYVQELALDKWRQVIDSQSFALSQDPDTWRRIRRDAIFAFVINSRRRKVASRGWRITPATDTREDKALAGMVEQAFKAIPRFWTARHLLTAADFRGTAYLAITGGLRPWAPVLPSTAPGVGPGDPSKPDQLVKAPLREWWMFGKLKDVDSYRFRLVPRGENRAWEFYSVKRQIWEPLLHPEWFIRHVYEDTEQSRGQGEGLLDALYFIWYTKMTCLELGLQGVEAWANGRLEVAIEGLREPAGTTNQAIARSWRNEIKHWLRDHAMIHDKQDEAKLHDGPSQGHNMAVEFLQYCDSAACRLCLGAELPFGGNQGGGSLARSKEEGDQSDEYVQPSRDILSETVTDSLIPAWVNRNANNLMALGLATASLPRFELYAEPAKDTLKNADKLAKILRDCGMPLIRAEAYAAVDHTPPGPEDEVIEPPTPPAPAPGLGGFNLDQPPGGEQ